MITAPKAFSTFASKIEADLSRRFGAMDSVVQNISIGRNKDSVVGNLGTFKFSPSMLVPHAIYAACDSKIRSYYANEIVPGVRVESSPEYQNFVASRLAEGKTKDSIANMTQAYMTFDAKSKQLVIMPIVKGVNDSLLTSSELPYWNIGFLNKVFKQPFATSYAKNLVSVEGFGNAWADVVAVFKESFEGFGRISNVARGSVQTNNSSPVTNKIGTIMSDIVNIAVDYESSIEEMMRAQGQPGNFLSGVAMADREKYAMMVLERIHDALIYFGNDEANVDGLLDLATGGVQNYAGTPLNDIVESAVITTKGAQIVQAFNRILHDFLQANAYMPTEVKINCSTYVYKAMASTNYSDAYNPDSPIKTLNGTFKPMGELDGGAKGCKYTLTADPMLDPNTPFNPLDSDLMVITIPSVGSSLEDQTGLVISPEVLKSFIVPPVYQRSGLLYTMYKRVGGIIAPVQNTIQVWRGFGYAGS